MLAALLIRALGLGASEVHKAQTKLKMDALHWNHCVSVWVTGG